MGVREVIGSNPVISTKKQNEIHNKFTVWNQEFGNELNKFTTILSAEQQRYTSEVTEYNLNVTLEMQNLKINLEKGLIYQICNF